MNNIISIKQAKETYDEKALQIAREYAALQMLRFLKDNFYLEGIKQVDAYEQFLRSEYNA